MMNKRELFVNYVRNGGDNFCSPQIGAGAGFDTRLANKEWISETTLQDTLSAVEMFDIIPLINVGCPYEICLSGIEWKENLVEKEENRIMRDYFMETPAGTLSRKSVEEKKVSPFLTKYAVCCEEDLDPFEYYLNALMDADFSPIVRTTQDAVSTIDGKGALSVQWPVQPYELLCFPNTTDTVLLAHDSPERFELLMNKIVAIDEKLMNAVAEGGADFIFLGAPASEMLSPEYYEKYIIPYSQVVTAIAHSLGLMVYSHICSPIEPFLTKGYYNRMGIDLFETLSGPPVGNVKSLKGALDKIDCNICTRGNLGLDILLNCNEEEIKVNVGEILEAAKGRKHIVAASDYLFYEVPEKSIKAMADAVKHK